MDGIKLFLERFKNLLPPDDQLKTLLVEIIKEECGVPLDKKSITVNRWSVFVKAPAAAKNEIYLHQEKILERLASSLGHQGVKRLVWDFNIYRPFGFVSHLVVDQNAQSSVDLRVLQVADGEREFIRGLLDRTQILITSKDV